MESNIFDTALVLEGGAMRASYTAPVIQALLAEEMFFDHVSGISAGGTLLSNYISRDPWRAKAALVEFGGDPHLGNLRTFLRGRGLFDSEYIYEHTADEGEALPFKFDSFFANPAQIRVGTFNANTGKQVWWENKDMATKPELLKRLRASASMPILMPPTDIDGEMHVDGAIGSSAGIPLEVAKRDGFDKFVVVLTRPRDYVKVNKINDRVYRRLLRKYPLVAEAVIERPKRYNEVREEIIELEKQGHAFVFWAENMSVSGQERNVAKLEANFALGKAQIERDMPRLKEFLGI